MPIMRQVGATTHAAAGYRNTSNKRKLNMTKKAAKTEIPAEEVDKIIHDAMESVEFSSDENEFDPDGVTSDVINDVAAASAVSIPGFTPLPHESTLMSPEAYSLKMALRMLSRTRWKHMLEITANLARMGVKKNGKPRANQIPRYMDEASMQVLYQDTQERIRLCDALQKHMKKLEVEHETYKFFSSNPGVGSIVPARIIGETNIFRADTASKLWQYYGLNPGLVRGIKRVPNNEYTEKMGQIVGIIPTPKSKKPDLLVRTDHPVRGDKLTKGFVAPFNTSMRMALCGIMGPNLMKYKDKKNGNARSRYVVDYYLPYKNRLEHSENLVLECGKKVEWRKATPMHRHRAAIRYMVKMFVIDLHKAWRTALGLEVRAPYSEGKLGHVHGAAGKATVAPNAVVNKPDSK